MKTIKVGVIGCGQISHTYINNMVNRYNVLDVVGCADIIPERAADRAKEFDIKQMTNEEIYNDPDIQIVVNLTYPTSHYEVNKAALLAGKNIYCEKMIAVTLEEGVELVKIAKEKNLRIAMAPDTFLGAGYQTARKLIDKGMIGEPFMAQAMVVRGYHQDRWPAPKYEFTWQPGGGIPFDMGGYYLHALVHLLGPWEKATGFAKCFNPNRKYSNTISPVFGNDLNIQTINALVGSLMFKSGALGGITFVSEGFGETPRVEIYGREGTLICPDPNTFGGPVYMVPSGGGEMVSMPITHGFSDGCCRGLGVADLAWAIINDRPHRANGDIGLHVFETIHGIWKSSQNDEIYTMQYTCEQPAPIASGYVEAGMDEYSLAI